jgi:hypothetical protein
MITTILLGVFLLSSFSGNLSNTSASSTVISSKVSNTATPTLKSQMYTSEPSAAVFTPANQTIFGAEMEMLTPAYGLDQIVAAKAAWTRRNAVPWSIVEPAEGVRDWSVLSGLESELQNASSKGLQVILIVRSTPEWARKIAGAGPSCGAVSPAKLAALGNFMHDLVARYSVPPYNVKFWELWNEPDVDPSLVQVDSVYGCWGDQKDPYYGGRYYADMLKVVYPQIKAVDPQAQVLVGGLLMDCDPRPGAGCAAVGHSTLPNKFLEGILVNNGGAYFDGISFHAYDFYENQLGKYGNPGWQSASNTTGPAVTAKAQFLRSLLNQYGVTGKFLINTEVALLCDTCSNDPVYEDTKAYYVAQEYAAAIALGLRANLWFTVLGWRNSGLLNPDLSPRPAYTAFQFSSNELEGAVLLREIAEYPGVKGYEFQLGNRHILVLWSLDGTVHSVTPPLPLLAAWDSLGSSVPTSSSMNVGFNPLYLELNVTCGVTVSCGVTTGVFRPSNGLLYLKNSNITGFADAALNYGLGGDYPVVGDWDGNGTTTIGVYRNGHFYLRNENTIGFAEVVFPFGTPGDQPIAGDWDGDGVDTIGVYRPSIGQFLLRNSNSEGPDDANFYLGNVGDVGIAGDWDADGMDTTGVFRPSNGIIFLKNKNETGFADVALNYGLPGDQPVTGDWDGDGDATIGIYRNGSFYLRNSNTIGFADLIFALGDPGDMPIAGNWDALP